MPRILVAGFMCFFVMKSGAYVAVSLLLQLGSTAIGLKTKDGVVLAVEKRVTSPLLVLAESPFLLNWS
jgi:hypothetical protein